MATQEELKALVELLLDPDTTPEMSREIGELATEAGSALGDDGGDAVDDEDDSPVDPAARRRIEKWAIQETHRRMRMREQTKKP